MHYATLQRWLLRYRKEGVEQLIQPITRNKPSKFITPEIHTALESRLGQSDNPFSGYVEVQQWLLKTYNVKIGYSFVWEIDGVDSKIFEHYLEALSKSKPKEFKVVVIDNAAFHSSTANIKVPENIQLLNIPPYCPELNPCEQIWQYIKKRYRNKNFENLKTLKQWLWDMKNREC